MKLLLLAYLISLSVLVSCQSQKTRTINSSETSTDSTQINLTEKKFEIIMSHELSGEKRQAFINYIQRQRDIYYIAQDLLNHFDNDLDQLYKTKKSGQILSPTDFENFERSQFQMRIAWEFSERNLHELLDLYELVLKHANAADSKHHTAARLILNQWPSWMQEGWKSGDQLAIISLGQNLSGINTEFTAHTPGARVVNFDRYAKASRRIREQAHLQSRKYAKQRSKTLIDTFIAKEWQTYQNERLLQKNREIENREPQALDILEPAADGKGHVTGNRFPQGTWAITLDDGPHPTHTKGIYDTLRENQVTGTFFWLSKNIIIYKDLVKLGGEMGFNRASHSYTHAQLSKLDATRLNKEITQAAVDFESVVGQPPTLFRCPYGDCAGNNSAVRQLIAKNNMLHIGWNVDTLDWQDKNPSSIFERAKKQIDILGRGIILFHDIHPQSVAALKQLIPYMKKSTQKYQIKPLPEIISIVREKSYVSP